MFQDVKHKRTASAASVRGVGLCSAIWLSTVAGCSFDEAQPAAAPNTCSAQADCPTDLSCQAGVCVTPAVDTPLDVTLEVTPKRMPDGSQPFAILYGPFSLQGGRRDFPLGVPATISGVVRDGPELINAQLTFVPTKASPTLAKPVQTRSSVSLLRSSTFSVQLLAGIEYRVTVQPTDPTVPPFVKVFTADPADSLNIDYADNPRVTQSFLIRNVPTVPVGQTLNMRARSKESGQILSNTMAVGDGRALLTFSFDTLPSFRVEISPSQNITSNAVAAAASDCDAIRPLLPSFTIDDSAFKREASTNVKAANGFDLAVDLPSMPQPIPYEGTIQLCEAKKGSDNLLVSLSSSALALNSLPPGISASFSVSTNASRQDDKNQNFCTRVLPGEYVVLVTPPTAVNCEIFAQKRQIVVPSDEPDVLALRVPTKLNGKILDSQMLPIANATIDAVALGIQTTMMLAENDATVPIYNRSRQTASGSNGGFAFYVDVGVYDLIVKPPAQSGFAWQIQPNLNVGGSRSEDFTTRVELSAPALIEGNLRYMDGSGKGTLAGADVHAYTVEDEKTPNARGVEIGHTQADENGNVVLFVSPEPQPPW
jgi:hypothetical protein